MAATETTMSTSNKACCTIAPVQTDYQPKGTYEDIASIKTYVVGPKAVSYTHL